MRSLRLTKETTSKSTILSPPKIAHYPEDGFSGRGDSSNFPLAQNSQMDSRPALTAFSKSELYKLFMTHKETSMPESLSFLAALVSEELMKTPLKGFLVSNPDVFAKHFDFVFFCYVFGLKNELLGLKYKPLFTENLFSSPFISAFQQSLLEFFEEKYDENSLGRQDGYKQPACLKSNLGGNSRTRRPRYDDFTDSDVEELQRKWGVIVNGEDGCGKTSAIQAFINTFSFEVEQIDLSSSEKMRSVMNKFSSAVTMNDVKISLNNIEETGRDTDSFFYNSTHTKKGVAKRANLQSNSISKFNADAESIQNSKQKSKRKKAKDDFVVEISDDDKPVASIQKNTLSSFFKKAEVPAPKATQATNISETSIRKIATEKKTEKREPQHFSNLKANADRTASRKSKKNYAAESRCNQDLIDADLEYSSNRPNMYKPAMFDQDSKNFSSNKGLYWNTRKIYLCRNIDLFYSSEFVSDRRKGLKKMEEFCLMLEKSNYPFVFIQQARYNEVFDQVISHFDVLDKQPYSKQEIDLLVYLILFFEVNFSKFRLEKGSLKEGQLMEGGVSYQNLYEESLRKFSETYKLEALQTPNWLKTVYVNNLLNYNLVKIFSFAEIHLDTYTSFEGLRAISRSAVTAECSGYFLAEGRAYFNQRGCLNNEPDIAIEISSPAKPRETSRLKKIAKIKSEKKSARMNRDEGEEQEGGLTNLSTHLETAIQVDFSFETDGIFSSTCIKNPPMLKASWTLETDFWLRKEDIMVCENDEDIALLKAIDLQLSRASVNDQLQRIDRSFFTESHNPITPLGREKDMNEYIEVLSKVKEIVDEQRKGFNKMSEDWGLDTRMSHFEIEKLKLFAQTPDDFLNGALKTRAQRRKMRDSRQEDSAKTMMLIDKFTRNQRQLALLKRYFPYF